MDHKHNPTFWNFMFSLKHCWKGLGFRYYTCKYCGQTIQLVEEQRKKYNLLSAIPPIAMVPFFFVGKSTFIADYPFLFVGFIYVILYSILCWVPFFTAFIFAKFTESIE